MPHNVQPVKDTPNSTDDEIRTSDSLHLPTMDHRQVTTRVDSSQVLSRQVLSRHRTQAGVPPMADSSFDIVSKVDRQELDNALNQTAKELVQRFDFKGTDATIEWKGELAVELSASTEERVAAALEVFRDKLVKRQISLKSLTAGDPRSSGKEYKISCTFAAGISQEQAKKLGKIIRDEGPKSVKTQVMGEELRVTSKSRDDLQEVQALVRGADLDFAVQFVNYR
jgi:uncharacterized protein YajQ (UPF0234 family)